MNKTIESIIFKFVDKILPLNKIINFSGGNVGLNALINQFNRGRYVRFYGVMVSTLDSESSDPSSNLGRT